MRLHGLAIFAVALAAGVSGCGSSAPDLPASGGVQRSEVVGESSERFPNDSLRDWKSYADHVVVFRVVSEAEIPPSPENAARGEGLVGRKVTLANEKVLWSAGNAPPLPPEVTVSAPGWVLHDGQQIPLVVNGAPRIAVGERYIAPLFRLEEDPQAPEWGPLSLAAQMPLTDGRVAPAPPNQHSHIRDQLAGKAIAEVEGLVRRADPDPRAQAHHDERPADRVSTVYAEQENGRSQQQGGP